MNRQLMPRMPRFRFYLPNSEGGAVLIEMGIRPMNCFPQMMRRL